MIFRFFKQIAAPNIFSKAVAQYKQGQYHIAKPLLVKSGQWMPSLEENPLYHALSVLCDHHLGEIGVDRLKTSLEALQGSPHKETDDYVLVMADIENLLDASDSAPPS